MTKQELIDYCDLERKRRLSNNDEFNKGYVSALLNVKSFINSLEPIQNKECEHKRNNYVGKLLECKDCGETYKA